MILEQTSIISDSETTSYYLWSTYFTKETLIKEAKEAGFIVIKVFGDVTGSFYHKDNFTIAILLEK